MGVFMRGDKDLRRHIGSRRVGIQAMCLLLVINLLAAAIFSYRLSENFGDATHTIEDAVMFAGLFFLGPGSYSVDRS
jgi:putative oxidoreductase